MHQRLLILPFILALFLSLAACSGQAVSRSTAPTAATAYQTVQHSDPALAQSIDRLIASTDPDVHIGVQVKSVSQGHVLYERDAERLFVPASVSKLFTATAAAVYLPDDFQYQTMLFVEGALTPTGELPGNVYLQFAGDPTLTSADLENLMTELRVRGVRHIQGDFYLDDFIFDDVGQGPGWMWDDSHYYYGSSISALVLDENEVPLVIRRQGKRLQVNVGSDHPGAFPVHNELVAVQEESSICPVRITMDARNEITVRGCVPANVERVSERLAIKNMSRYLEAVVRHLLEEQGVTLAGRVRTRVTPVELQPIAIHYSEPLPVILEQVLSESNNLATASLIKKLGAMYYGAPGTWEKGASATESILEPTGIDFSNLALVDGTGLSRYNQVRPRQVVQLLDWIYHHLSVSSQLANALAQSGKGTMSYRLLDRQVQDKVWAKTGAMTSVSSIAGYLRQEDGEMLAFMIVTNGFLGARRPYLDLEDRIIQQLAALN